MNTKPLNHRSLNIQSFSKVRYLRSVAPLPFGKAYSKILIHVFRLYGSYVRGSYVRNASRRPRNRTVPRSLSALKTIQTEADLEEPEEVARSL